LDIEKIVDDVIENHYLFRIAVKKDPSRRKTIRKWVEDFIKIKGRPPKENEMNPNEAMSRLEMKRVDELFEDPEKSSVVLRTLTPNTEYYSDEGAQTLAKVIEVMPKDARIVDIGTGTGEFVKKVIKHIDEPNELRLLRTNPLIPQEHKAIPNVAEDRILPWYDVIANEPDISEHLKDAHVVIVKDVLKFYPETRDIAWNRLVSHMKHGSLIVSGDTNIPGEGAQDKDPIHWFGRMRMEFHVVLRRDGKKTAVRVDPRKFAEEVSKVRNHNEYLQNIHRIVKKAMV